MKFERRVALFTGVVIVFFVLFLVYRDQPFSDPDLVVILRITLSLAIAVLGATIPGVLDVKYDTQGVMIRAAGALGLFVISFFGTPSVTSLKLDGLSASLNHIDELIKKNYLSDAELRLEKLIKEHPERAEVWNGMGKLCVRSTEYGCALESFEKAVNYSTDVDQKNNYLNNLGFAQSATNDVSGAIDTYENLLALATNGRKNRATVFNLSVSLTHAGRVTEAREHLSWLYNAQQGADYRAIAKYFLGVGWLLDTPAAYENAIQEFREAIGIENDIRTLILGTKENIQIDGQSFYFGPSVENIKLHRSDPCFNTFISELRNGRIHWENNEAIICA